MLFKIIRKTKEVTTNFNIILLFYYIEKPHFEQKQKKEHEVIIYVQPLIISKAHALLVLCKLFCKSVLIYN